MFINVNLLFNFFIYKLQELVYFQIHKGLLSKYQQYVG